MKYLLSAILISLIVIGCGKTSDKTTTKAKDKFAFDSSDVATKPVANPNAKFTLKYNFIKGKTYHYRLTSISHDDQEIKIDTTISRNIDQTLVYLMNLTVKNIDKDSIMEISCDIPSIKLDANADGKKYNYQSGVTPDSIAKTQFSEYEAIINNPFRVRVSTNGEIKDIYSLDKIVEKYLNLKNYSDSVTVDQKDMLRNQMIEGALKPILIQVFRKLPDKSLAKDSTWTHNQPPSKFLVFQLHNTNIYKVMSLDEMGSSKIAVLDAGLITKVSGNNTYKQQGVSYVFKKPHTKASGKIFFNVTNGYVQKSKTKTDVNISFKINRKTSKGNQTGSKVENVINTNIVELL